MMNEWITQIQNYIQQYINGSPIIYMYIAGLMFLCFRGKDKRRMLVYPSIILMIVIINPVLYGYVWIKFIEYGFWRMLWMIPVLPVIGVAVVEFAGIIKKEWVMYVATVVFIAVVFIKCDNIYRQEAVFVETDNYYKLPEASVDIGNYILQYKEEPVVLAPEQLYCYLRQYKGDIKLVYGRDAQGFILPITDETINELIQIIGDNSGDTARLIELAEERDTDIIILPNDTAFWGLESYGYEMIGSMHGYYIYLRLE